MIGRAGFEGLGDGRLPWPLGPAERRSIVRLIGDGTLDAGLAALLWLTVEARLPVIVAAGPRGTGKSTVLDAALAFPFYTWGEPARIAVRALSRGYGLGGTIHAESLEEVFAELGGPRVGLTDDELSHLGIVLILRAFRGRAGEEPLRRIVAAHYVRPVARDSGGHVQRLGPAVLATWDGEADRFEDFSWGVASELAERVGRTPAEFELERDRRSAYLTQLVETGVDDPDAVAVAIGHWAHRGP